MKVIDLFSGIGGFALGAHHVGYETKLFVEKDPYAQSVLRKNFPIVPMHDDVTTLTLDEGSCDIICGGFPCQDISVANPNGKGLDGERSGLWSEFNRLIQEGKPKYVIIENSPNLRNKGLRRVLQDLWEGGYDAEWCVLEAGQFGAHHIRQRVFIVAYPISTRGERLVKDEYLEEVGQRGVCGETGLLTSVRNPFERSDCWPQPLLRRGDDGLSRRVDRLRCVGNAVYPPIAKFLFECIKKAEDEVN